MTVFTLLNKLCRDISCVFLVEVGLTTIFNVFALVIRRLIMGLCVGAYVTVIP